MPKDYESLQVTHAEERIEPASPKSEPAAPQTPSSANEAPEKKGSGLTRRLILGAIALAVIAVGAKFAHGYWTDGRFQISTDDAYVQADFAIMAPRITGYVAKVPAVENSMVKAGDPLVVLENGDYQDALHLAQAQIDAQRAAVERISRQMLAADATVEQANARVAAAKAVRTQTEADLARYVSLAGKDVATEQKLEEARAANESAEASVQEAVAGVATAVADREVTAAEKREAEAVLPGLAADLSKAQRDLDSTILRAPSDGVVGNLSVAQGDYVTPGKRLLAIVPLTQVYVEANFKETQIEPLAPGTKVKLHVDAFPDRDFEGTVDGIAPASGSVFSLLPPENATGNFTKVVQRLPIRINVPAEVADQGWLRPGLSVTVSADTRTTPATNLAAR